MEWNTKFIDYVFFPWNDLCLKSHNRFAIADLKHPFWYNLSRIPSLHKPTTSCPDPHNNLPPFYRHWCLSMSEEKSILTYYSNGNDQSWLITKPNVKGFHLQEKGSSSIITMPFGRVNNISVNFISSSPLSWMFGCNWKVIIPLINTCRTETNIEVRAWINSDIDIDICTVNSLI